MAKLGRAPSSAEIVALRGVVDLYHHKGVWVARSWPRRSTHVRTAGEIASSEEFTAAAKMTGALAPVVEEAWKLHVVGHGCTWVDMFRAACRGKGWFRGVD